MTEITRVTSPRSILIHEYLSGGGCAGRDLPGDLATEGLAILRAVLADCAAWGGARVVTMLDWRLAAAPLSASEVILVKPGHYQQSFGQALEQVDAALIVAPETGGILAGLLRRVAAAGVCSLGSTPEAVQLAGDKWRCYRSWHAAGVPTPRTARWPGPAAEALLREAGYPVVLKPAQGVGCAGVRLAGDAGELVRAEKLAREPRARGVILIQPYVPGTHASVSLLVAGGRAVPLSLNAQDILPGSPFSYRGGTVPLSDPQQGQAFASALAAVGAIPGLCGYVGVDLVLDGRQAWVIELNPRVTTAYVGLRQVASANLFEAMWKAALFKRLPASFILRGSAKFSKNDSAEFGEVIELAAGVQPDKGEACPAL